MAWTEKYSKFIAQTQASRRASTLAARRPDRVTPPLAAKQAAPRPATRRPAATVTQPVDFSHLRAAGDRRATSMRADVQHLETAELERWSGIAVVPDPVSAARGILAAGAKARTPTSGPPATGLAKQIIEAGKRRRGEL